MKALTFDLLVTLVRAAPNLVSFNQLSERVWPGLVITPETIVQRLKLLRSALGDDPHTPRYIEGVRGRGYRMVAEVRLLTERPDGRESIVPPSFEQTQGPASIAATHAVKRVPRGWIGRALIIVALLAGSWAIIHYRGAGKPPEPANVVVSPVFHSLVVLPLENLSGDREQEYFAEGMTDALTTDLAQVNSLRVISRTSAMQFKRSRESLPMIGRDLKVDVVVEGTVTRSADRVRITAQLVEARTDHHLWAKTYERDLKDVLALQDEIARDITEQISFKLTPKARGVASRARTADSEAYDDYLRGRYWASRATLWGAPGDCAFAARKALGYYEKAIAKDPNYALGNAGVADGFVALALSGGLSYKEAAPKVNEAAVTALALDSSLAEPHVSLGYIKLFNDWDFAGAEADLKQAIALNPNFARAHFWYGYYLVITDRLDEAVKETERARDLDPFDYAVNEWLGQALYHARRYDEALRQIQRTLEMFPDHEDRLTWEIADVYEQKKMFAGAFAARQRSLSLDKDPDVSALDEAYKRAGYRGWLLKAVQLREQRPSGPAAFGKSAHLYAMLDDEPHAMSYLERAYDAHRMVVLFIRTAPELDSIRSSPRFHALVRRIGFPQPSR